MQQARLRFALVEGKTRYVCVFICVFEVEPDWWFVFTQARSLVWNGLGGLASLKHKRIAFSAVRILRAAE